MPKPQTHPVKPAARRPNPHRPVPVVALSLLSLVLAIPAFAQTSLLVTFADSVRAEPATGRLVVYLIAPDAGLGRGAKPADGPFFEQPQPMFGVDVRDARPGEPMLVDDTAASFPGPLSLLAPGTYRAQAVLDMHRLDSSWRREPGNLYSEVVEFTVEAGARSAAKTVTIPLTRSVVPRATPKIKGVELFEVRSALLSDFRGEEVLLRAGVRLPAGFDPQRRYAAVYEVPGFGGDHLGAFRPARRQSGDAGLLASSVFWITLDPEGPNGHSLFADSDNNGPVGRALVEEMIPALEAAYPLIPEASARLLRGHSSGGWSTLWLALTYPETFGACWSSSPDPVDFHRMQLVDIYDDANFYTRDGRFLPSMRADGSVTMTIRQENLMEEVLGPDNSSGQQWDSWFAVFGPRDERGNPAPLFDPESGKIDRAIAERYKPYDIADRVHAEAGALGLIFKQRIRLLVGDQDSYYLNEAVARLKPEIDKLSFLTYPEGGNGYIKILPGYDHGTIFRAPEMRAIPSEMLDHLRRAGHLPRQPDREARVVRSVRVPVPRLRGPPHEHPGDELLHVDLTRRVEVVVLHPHRAQHAVAEADVDQQPRDQLGREVAGDPAVLLGAGQLHREEALQRVDVGAPRLVDVRVVHLRDRLEEHPVGIPPLLAHHGVVADEGLEPLGGVLGVGQILPPAVDRPLARALDQRDEQIPLRLEVPVDDRLGDARRPGKLRGRRPGVAVGREEFGRAIEQLLTTLGCRQATHRARTPLPHPRPVPGRSSLPETPVLCFRRKVPGRTRPC